MRDLHGILPGKKNIFDIGTGPTGSYWWSLVDADASIVGIDWFFFPKEIPENVKVYKMNASHLGMFQDGSTLDRLIGPEAFEPGTIKWTGQFDMVIANHVLEHVESPEGLIEGAARLLKPGGTIYAGFPEATNFTDIFYHLVHPDGGGHIQKITKDGALRLFEKNGFKLVSCEPWPDDWKWFELCYNPVAHGIKTIEPHEIRYLCDVFRKELTPEKGYHYGWEMVFEKA